MCALQCMPSNLSEKYSLNKIVISDRVYIPRNLVNISDVKDLYEKKLYNQSGCNSCPIFKAGERHSETCNICPNFLEHLVLWSKTTKDGKKKIVVPSGNLHTVKKLVDLTDAHDIRPIIPMHHHLIWTGKLYTGQIIDGNKTADQVALTQEWFDKHKETGGLIHALPRTGKTCCAVNLICRLQVRTLIVASQMEFLQQFCKRFAENTNLLDLHEQGKKPLLLICPNGWEEADKYGVIVYKHWKDVRNLNNYSCVLSTYQQFIHQKTGSLKIQKYVENKFSMITVDEVDMASAEAFSRFINHVPFRYKLGLTATVQRKDQRQVVINRIMGPVLARSVSTALLPQIKLIETGIKFKSYKEWYHLENALVRSKERNILLVRQIFTELRQNPNHSILLPVKRIEHLVNLVKLINQQAEVNNLKRGEDWPEELAIPYQGGSDKDLAFAKIEKKNCKVVVAIARMTQRGLDVRRWTHVYTAIIPTNNGPIFSQLAARCCTPYLNKPCPIVNVLIDWTGASIYCFKSLFFSEILPNLKDQLGKPARYKMDSETLKRAWEIAKFPRSYYPKNQTKHVPVRRF